MYKPDETADRVSTSIAWERNEIGRIAHDADFEMVASDLASRVSHLAELEGALEVYATADRALVGGATVDQLAVTVTAMLLVGADDTWSGRKNDAARSRFDGKRSAVREVLNWNRSRS